jgi:hypothetical protein
MPGGTARGPRCAENSRWLPSRGYAPDRWSAERRCWRSKKFLTAVRKFATSNVQPARGTVNPNSLCSSRSPCIGKESAIGGVALLDQRPGDRAQSRRLVVTSRVIAAALTGIEDPVGRSGLGHFMVMGRGARMAMTAGMPSPGATGAALRLQCGLGASIDIAAAKGLKVPTSKTASDSLAVIRSMFPNPEKQADGRLAEGGENRLRSPKQRAVWEGALPSPGVRGVAQSLTPWRDRGNCVLGRFPRRNAQPGPSGQFRFWRLGAAPAHVPLPSRLRA